MTYFVKLRLYYHEMIRLKQVDLLNCSKAELNQKVALVCKLKDDAWEEAKKGSLTMKSIKTNKIFRETYTNAFKQLTQQLNDKHRDILARVQT